MRAFGIIAGSGCGYRPVLAALISASALIPVPQASIAQVACLPIQRIDVQGAQRLTPASVDAAVAPYQGKCLGLMDFNAVLQAITDLYIDAGLVTSRVYLPEQDLSTGVLTLAAVEGRIERVTFNGREDRLWERFSFPAIRGAVGNLRDIEQGLDNIRAMPSYVGTTMELTAGSATGFSVLDVTATPDPKPWRLSVSADNYGFVGDDGYNPTLSLGWDNLIGINDRWDFSYTRAADQFDFNTGAPGNDSEQAVIDVTVPYGKWSYNLRQSWSAYESYLPGNETGSLPAIVLDGESQETRIAATRLLHRDQISKTDLTFDLTRSRSTNRVAGQELDTSSRVLSWVGVGLSHQRSLWDGQFLGALRFEQGLTAFGAENADAQPDGSPDAQYRLLLVSADYVKAFPLENLPGAGVVFSTSAWLQYSPDRLYGDQQFQLGGNSTIRGTKVALAYGSSGVFWRGEAEYRLNWPGQNPELRKWLGAPAVYVSLDAGRVFEQSDIDAPGGSALGGVAGLRLVGGKIGFDIGYAKVLRVSDGLQKPEGHMRAAINIRF